MARQSFADIMNANKLMLAGLRNHIDQLTRRGIDTAWIDGYAGNQDTLQTTDNEQERLKAEVSAKTKEVNEGLEDLNAQYSEAKKLVKMEIDPTVWKEFGITDKR